jgi:RNA polymerase sigma-70 factor, ECF subfamily
LDFKEQNTIGLLKTGDQKALEMVFRNWYTPLCRFAWTYLNDKDEAEEVVQSVFVQFWEKRGDISIDTSLKSYLYSSVRNASLNVIKHRKVRADHAKFVTSNAQSATQMVQSDELQKRIDAAINKLPEQCRLVFQLSRWEELKYAEIADRLSISVKTVENHIGKALRIMREELKDYLPLMAIFIKGFID